MIAKSMRFLLIHFLNTFFINTFFFFCCKNFWPFQFQRSSTYKYRYYKSSTDEDFRNEGCYRVKIINIPRRGIPLTPSSGDQEVGGRYTLRMNFAWLPPPAGIIDIMIWMERWGWIREGKGEGDDRGRWYAIGCSCWTRTRGPIPEESAFIGNNNNNFVLLETVDAI